MPLGEVVAELVIRPLFELMLSGLCYWTGWLLLKALTFGTIRIAAFSSIWEDEKKKRKWNQIDWSIWIHDRRTGKCVKAEFTILLGIVLWITIGFGIFFALRSESPSREKPLKKQRSE